MSPCEPHVLEEHNIGPAPKHIPRPLFVVGDVIIYNVPGSIKGLQQGFVLMGDKAKYCIQLEEGRTVRRSTRESWLSTCWAPGKFTPDQDDPFVTEKANKKLKMGSYGIHVDSQLEALRKVTEAKEFAKAVKADNTGILVYLWNDRIRLDGITKERQDATLNAFRKMGHCWF
jgi:hypothetical protein